MLKRSDDEDEDEEEFDTDDDDDDDDTVVFQVSGLCRQCVEL